MHRPRMREVDTVSCSARAWLMLLKRTEVREPFTPLMPVRDVGRSPSGDGQLHEFLSVSNIDTQGSCSIDSLLLRGLQIDKVYCIVYDVQSHTLFSCVC
ncbi:hypothetical protein NDU88_001626 [Pleurodeles waltl]|uniref:Uncharacterized protein n=1 Tax=Pleurodeles waltl TaxID=8319 RepID=A0AAV7KSG6_PLEWA|nr:hypothetical protein NDU88_001626 [Pleurodeles waltl]